MSTTQTHMCDTFSIVHSIICCLFFYHHTTTSLKTPLLDTLFLLFSANTQHLFWSGAHDSIVWIETIINLLLLFNVISFLFFRLAFRLSKNKVANANKNKHTHLTRNGKLKIWIMTNGTIRTHFTYTPSTQWFTHF